MEELLTGNIDFQLTIDTTQGKHTFNATLKNIEGEFRIYLSVDKTISFTELSMQSAFWNDEISHFSFGKNIQTKNALINGKEIEFDLSKAKLINMQHENHEFYFKIDTYQYQYTDTGIQDNALFYLNASSSILSDFTKYASKEEQKYNIANIEFTISPYSDTHPYIVKYHNFDSIEHIIDKNNILLDLFSFYYGSLIEVQLIIVQQSEHTRIIYKQPSFKLIQNSHKNMDLAYLSISDFNYFAQVITSKISDIKTLHTLINDYIRAKYLDNTSAFLILYSILETFADTTPAFFDDRDTMQQVFKTLFTPFIEKMKNSHEKNNKAYTEGSPNFKAIKNKWNNLAQELIKKPKEINPIKKLIEENNIDWEKLNRNFSTMNGNETKIRNIKDLRNAIVHDRQEDYTQLLDMANINSDLSFAVCIILLKKLGVTNINWGCWNKLSITK